MLSSSSYWNVHASLNVDPLLVEQNIADLREKVFVDVRFVQESPFNTLDYDSLVKREKSQKKRFAHNPSGRQQPGGPTVTRTAASLVPDDFPLTTHPHKVCSSVDGPRCFDDSMLSTVPKSVMQYVEGDSGDERSRWLHHGVLPGSGVDQFGETALSSVGHWSLDQALVKVGASVPEGVYKRSLADRRRMADDETWDEDEDEQVGTESPGGSQENGG